MSTSVFPPTFATCYLQTLENIICDMLLLSSSTFMYSAYHSTYYKCQHELKMNEQL